MTTTDAILADLTAGRHRGVVVDAPPGAGKSTLVVDSAIRLDQKLMIVAQTNEQVDDLIDRLAGRAPSIRIGRLSSMDYRPSERVLKDNVTVGSRLVQLNEPQITIATAAKWGTLTDGTWEWAIVDEAYQMRSDALLRVASRFERALFVGDPGQLDPFSTVGSSRWTGLSWDPLHSAVTVLLGHNPDLPVHRLPVSWRLPASAASVVASSFYAVPFTSGTAENDRRLELTPGGSSSVDQVIDVAAATGWGLYELPPRHTIRTDSEAANAVVDIACRLLAREPLSHSERGTHPVTGDRVAIGAAHRDQVAAIRTALAARLPDSGITVDTANRLQGREYDVTIVLHPLSGRRDATAFHLEAGRLCVLTSRHRHSCIVVSRAGVVELLDAHPGTAPVVLDAQVPFVDGWAAHHTMMAHFSVRTVTAQ
ncbi:MAG: AAA family ATPase [Longispora sp.]|nr:AAA family ATPase [Longispora sp. (in: high G+C Gram-positive bacteria)]